MKSFLAIVFIVGVAAGAFAQAKTFTARKSGSTKPPGSHPAAAKIPAVVPIKKGSISNGLAGRTYANKDFGFEVTFPVSWLIPGDDFESEMKKAGFDLSLSPPSSVNAVDRARMNKALQKIKVLVTAYRSMPGSEDNAIVRISTEDLGTDPQIRDAVDYFDAMRSQFASMKLPPDFKYSETGAEQLGKQQFAYIDTTSSEGKKRLYATVRKRHAILFSISYSKDDDLQALRQVLSEGNFALAR
ncbi:MAG: hypothetical protein IT173_12965 [Acidobacteria bacterium]|nr:hypothetical protein [Acidobacteriota bacterium]